jgi:hypothetical protein
VLVTALWQESTAVRVGGSLSVSVGGPISRTAFITVGAYAFACAALIWPQFQERRRLSRDPSAEQTQFATFTDQGFEVGMSGGWTLQLAWELVSRVRLSRRKLHIQTPEFMIDVDAGLLDDAEYDQLRAHFAATRSIVERARFFGWRWKHRIETTTFGRLKHASP